MDGWIDVRCKARALHEKALAATNGDRKVEALVAATIKGDDPKVRDAAADLVRDGIRVNAISAGPKRTLAGSAVAVVRARSSNGTHGRLEMEHMVFKRNKAHAAAA